MEPAHRAHHNRALHVWGCMSVLHTHLRATYRFLAQHALYCVSTSAQEKQLDNTAHMGEGGEHALSALACLKTVLSCTQALMQRGQQAAWKQNLRVAAASCPLATGGS